MKIDDSVVDNRATGAMPNQVTAPSSLRIGVGAFYPGTNQGGEVNVDNVVVRFQ